MHGHDDKARNILRQVGGDEHSEAAIRAVHASLAADAGKEQASFAELWQPALRLAMTIGISVAILQQITGINAVFFYAPMIFEQSGIGTDASFMQAILVGLVNLLFTVFAILLIDKLGRRPLLGFGLTGIVVCMLLLAYGFSSATYTLDEEAMSALPAGIERTAIAPLQDVVYDSDIAFRKALADSLGADGLKRNESALVTAAISMNPTLILIGILGFVASFAISIGPVMWVLFSELFPNRIRGLAISFVGLINSAVSFFVQLVFPWELANVGNAGTFLIYGLLALAGLFLVMRLLPETKGKSLEELEGILSVAQQSEAVRP
jgi:MFS family permease